MSLERVKKSLQRQPGEFRDASLVIVATEGEHTERLYLDQFRNRRVKVVPVVCEDGTSSPEGTLNRLNVALDAFDVGDGDSFWLLVDRDQWTEAMFSQVRSQCVQKGYTLAVSNRRFEAFLALHVENAANSPLFLAGDYEAVIRSTLGSYNKTSYNAATLFENRHIACDQCRALDTMENAIFPPDHCSRAYLLVEHIESLVG